MSHAIQQVMIRGLVQGVGYRAWVEHQARTSKLEGWVRNRRDGSVEALFAGPPTVVAEMVALCRHGPPSSRISSDTRRPAPQNIASCLSVSTSLTVTSARDSACAMAVIGELLIPMPRNGHKYGYRGGRGGPVNCPTSHNKVRAPAGPRQRRS